MTKLCFFSYVSKLLEGKSKFWGGQNHTILFMFMFFVPLRAWHRWMVMVTLIGESLKFALFLVFFASFFIHVK